MAELAGSWELDNQENYEAFLKAAGMGSMKRAMAVKLGGSLTISFNGDGTRMKVKAVNGPKTKERDMPIGAEFDDEGPDGGSAKGSWTKQSDSKMTSVFTTGKGKVFKMDRTICSDGRMCQDMDFDGTTCKRFYKKK